MASGSGPTDPFRKSLLGLAGRDYGVGGLYEASPAGTGGDPSRRERNDDK